jgi:hypothetical protein
LGFSARLGRIPRPSASNCRSARDETTDRTNVETVIVAGKIRKWQGRLLDVDLPRLRQQLESSRDYLFQATGIPQDLFRPN